jgi:diacylglycerol kinase family enzyme
VGVLRLGSGNAIATYLGTESATEKLKALRAGTPLALHSLNMIDGADGLFPFAGIGWDAEILNDYEDFKDAVRETALENYATGLKGYVAAIATRTLPRVIRQKPTKIVVENRGDRALKVDQTGAVLEEFGPGEVLYKGPVRTCATAAVSYWGYRIRMFPYATARWGFAMLRCFRGTVGRILGNLPEFWRGKFPEGDIVDFLYEDVEIHTQGDALPYQVTGEAAGYEREIDWSVAAHPVKLAVPVQ